MITKCMFILLLTYWFYVEAACFFDVKNGYKHFVEKMNSINLHEVNVFPARQWIEQKLDHFDPNETRVWNMKYYERLKFWKNKGPIYLFLGGEYFTPPSLLLHGIIHELADETDGAMYATEHRYYGESIPVNGTTAKDYKFLTTKQALADIAALIRYIKSKPQFKYSKVVLIGGSYAGNLAAWMKLLYPDLIDAALASSSPVLAKKDFYELLETVKEDFTRYGTKGCIEKIDQKFERYNYMLKNVSTINQLKKEENICEYCDLTILENQQTFLISMISEFESTATYTNPNHIKKVCLKLNSTIESTQSQVVNIFWNSQNNCYDVSFDHMISLLKNKKNRDDLTWIYQICTEFGYFMTTNSDFQPFTKNVPLSYYIKLCSSLFGKEFNENRVDNGVKRVNNLYGGLRPNVSHVIFTNGEIDPWSKLSVLSNISSDAPSIVIPRGSHCNELHSDVGNDSQELVEARQRVKYLIKQWIGYVGVE